jgi:hypothetical protein
MLVIVAAVPIVLTMAVVRLLTLPWYPAWLYDRPGFPEDPYGFSREERLRLASATIRFLNIPGETDILQTLALSGGSLAYNDRELQHMDDVKVVYNGLTLAAAVMLAAGIAGGGALLRSDTASGGGKAAGAVASGQRTLWTALIRGATLTLVLLGALGVWMLLGFNRFFTAFHNVFFEPGTWVFYYTDTLIRLFPIQLWQTAGLLIAGTVALLSVILIVIGRWRQSRLTHKRQIDSS